MILVATVVASELPFFSGRFLVVVQGESWLWSANEVREVSSTCLSEEGNCVERRRMLLVRVVRLRLRDHHVPWGRKSSYRGKYQMRATLEICDNRSRPRESFASTFSWFSPMQAGCESLLGLVNSDPVLARKHLVDARQTITRILSDQCSRDRLTRFWMNPVLELNPFKSEIVDELVKVVALRSILSEQRFDRVVYTGRTRAVSRTLSALCEEIGIEFVQERFQRFSRLRVHRFLGAAYLARYLITRWPLRGKETELSANLTIVSYFAHLDWAELEKGNFKSNQWGGLRDSLLERENVDWIHLYISTTGQVSPRKARRSLDSLNASKDSHRFFDSELSLGIAAKAIARYFQNCLRSSGIARLEVAMIDAGLSAEWSAVRGHCLDGLVGVSFVRSTLTNLLIEKSVCKSTPGSTALLLWENQPWERSFIKHWHKVVGGRVFAYSHTTIPFWCLSYFDSFLAEIDSRGFAEISSDICLVNGPLSLQTLEEAGEPVARFTEVEAFRYLDLNETNRRLAGDSFSAALTVLLVGEIRVDPTLRMVRAVVTGVARSGCKMRIIFKPHPVSQVVIPPEIAGSIEVTTRDLPGLFDSCDAVIGCAGTSAVVEALTAGVPSASFLDPSELNLSSLIGWNNHYFLGDSDAVVQFLAPLTGSDRIAIPEPFHLEREMHRWQAVLRKTGIGSLSDS